MEDALKEALQDIEGHLNNFYNMVKEGYDRKTTLPEGIAAMGAVARAKVLFMNLETDRLSKK